MERSAEFSDLEGGGCVATLGIPGLLGGDEAPPPAGLEGVPRGGGLPGPGGFAGDTGPGGRLGTAALDAGGPPRGGGLDPTGRGGAPAGLGARAAGGLELVLVLAMGGGAAENERV